uniref:G6b-B extracellular V-set Ig-like domain-containing protein n=1 Tax=Terrapene triunguis TaxID=2587831 RepID=A0A674J262_9SAUR
MGSAVWVLLALLAPSLLRGEGHRQGSAIRGCRSGVRGTGRAGLAGGCGSGVRGTGRAGLAGGCGSGVRGTAIPLFLPAPPGSPPILLLCGARGPRLRWVWSPRYPKCAGNPGDLLEIARLPPGPEPPPAQFRGRLDPQSSSLGALLLRDLVMRDSGTFTCLGKSGAEPPIRLEVTGGKARPPSPHWGHRALPSQTPAPVTTASPADPLCPHRLSEQPYCLLQPDVPLERERDPGVRGRERPRSLGSGSPTGWGKGPRSPWMGRNVFSSCIFAIFFLQEPTESKQMRERNR